MRGWNKTRLLWGKDLWTCASHPPTSLIDPHPVGERGEIEFADFGLHVPLEVELPHHAPQIVRVCTRELFHRPHHDRWHAETVKTTSSRATRLIHSTAHHHHPGFLDRSSDRAEEEQPTREMVAAEPCHYGGLNFARPKSRRFVSRIRSVQVHKVSALQNRGQIVLCLCEVPPCPPYHRVFATHLINVPQPPINVRECFRERVWEWALTSTRSWCTWAMLYLSRS